MSCSSKPGKQTCTDGRCTGETTWGRGYWRGSPARPFRALLAPNGKDMKKLPVIPRSTVKLVSMIYSGPHKMGCQQRNGFTYDRKALGTGGSWK